MQVKQDFFSFVNSDQWSVVLSFHDSWLQFTTSEYGLLSDNFIQGELFHWTHKSVPLVTGLVYGQNSCGFLGEQRPGQVDTTHVFVIVQAFNNVGIQHRFRVKMTNHKVGLLCLLETITIYEKWTEYPLPSGVPNRTYTLVPKKQNPTEFYWEITAIILSQFLLYFFYDMFLLS